MSRETLRSGISRYACSGDPGASATTLSRTTELLCSSRPSSSRDKLRANDFGLSLLRLRRRGGTRVGHATGGTFEGAAPRGQQIPRASAAHERQPLLVLLGAGSLADEHSTVRAPDPRVVAVCGDRGGGPECVRGVVALGALAAGSGSRLARRKPRRRRATVTPAACEQTAPSPAGAGTPAAGPTHRAGIHRRRRSRRAHVRAARRRHRHVLGPRPVRPERSAERAVHRPLDLVDTRLRSTGRRHAHLLGRAPDRVAASRRGVRLVRTSPEITREAHRQRWSRAARAGRARRPYVRAASGTRG